MASIIETAVGMQRIDRVVQARVLGESGHDLGLIGIEAAAEGDDLGRHGIPLAADGGAGA